MVGILDKNRSLREKGSPAHFYINTQKTQKWEPSTEKMYVRGGVLTGDIIMALLLEGDVHYRCDFRTTYR